MTCFFLLIREDYIVKIIREENETKLLFFLWEKEKEREREREGTFLMEP